MHDAIRAIDNNEPWIAARDWALVVCVGVGDMATVETTSVPSHCSWISVLSEASPQIQYMRVGLVIIISVRVSDHLGHEHH